MRIAISFRDKTGKVHTDCSECKKGGKGDGSCPKGGGFKLAYRGGCTKGEVFSNLQVEELRY